jgi:hypothetical protein
MKSIRWLLVTVTVIGCTRETSTAPRVADVATSVTGDAISDAHLQATRQSLTRGEAGLRRLLSDLESDASS